MPEINRAVIIEPVARHRCSVIWLHGLGANGHDFEPIVPELNLPESSGIRFIFPHAPNKAITINGGMVMRAWYDVSHMDLRREEDADSIKTSGQLVEAYIDKEIECGISSENIILAGFSQGGAMALYSGLRYHQRLAGILALSSYLPLPDTLTNEAADANMNTPVMMCHGNFDPVIPVSSGQQSAEFLTSNGYIVDWHNYNMAHAVCQEEIRDIGNWIKSLLA